MEALGWRSFLRVAPSPLFPTGSPLSRHLGPRQHHLFDPPQRVSPPSRFNCTRHLACKSCVSSNLWTSSFVKDAIYCLPALVSGPFHRHSPKTPSPLARTGLSPLQTSELRASRQESIQGSFSVHDHCGSVPTCTCKCKARASLGPVNTMQEKHSATI